MALLSIVIILSSPNTSQLAEEAFESLVLLDWVERRDDAFDCRLPLPFWGFSIGITGVKKAQSGDLR